MLALPFSELANVGFCIGQARTALAKADESFHSLPALLKSCSVFLFDGLTDKLGNGGALLPGANMQQLPEMLLKVELSPAHDV